MSAITQPRLVAPGEGQPIDLGVGRPTIKLGPPPWRSGSCATAACPRRPPSRRSFRHGERPRGSTSAVSSARGWRRSHGGPPSTYTAMRPAAGAGRSIRSCLIIRRSRHPISHPRTYTGCGRFGEHFRNCRSKSTRSCAYSTARASLTRRSPPDSGFQSALSNPAPSGLTRALRSPSHTCTRRAHPRSITVPPVVINSTGDAISRRAEPTRGSAGGSSHFARNVPNQPYERVPVVAEGDPRTWVPGAASTAPPPNWRSVRAGGPAQRRPPTRSRR